MLYAHVIHEVRGLLTRRRIEHVPRTGEEIRLPDEKYYKVTLVVWCFDEETPMGQRVNIGVIEASPDTKG